jgi:hypothetical protein
MNPSMPSSPSLKQHAHPNTTLTSYDAGWYGRQWATHSLPASNPRSGTGQMMTT